ncbi:DUF808 domain-containing protein [Aureimonas frigidaquae]|uniref:DUF808 domain-containing protein n=1 Tax=Aureimonas frigidaquae TaxID=424757 RepID=UPI0007842E9C|nr:DUF808 domain-containing protein [Aureimonas frigidaquae]
MATGLLALLDDVAAIAKVAAASLDDVVAQSGRAGLKAAGIVIDDTAVTPRYVVGFAAERELPIVWRITLGSLRNKLLFLLPAALLLSAFAPWLIMPLLMLGGFYLCYEGAEKLLEYTMPHAGPDPAAKPVGDALAQEDAKIASAIRTDFILSAEIMALTLATIDADSIWMRAVVLAVVAVMVTVCVYGLVAIIVKADDVGVAMAASRVRTPVFGSVVRGIGRGLVKGMPGFLKLLAAVGTVAMLWVGGGILVHALESWQVNAPGHVMHAMSDAAAQALPQIAGVASWVAGAFIAALIGLAVGLVIVFLVHRIVQPALGMRGGH